MQGTLSSCQPGGAEASVHLCACVLGVGGASNPGSLCSLCMMSAFCIETSDARSPTPAEEGVGQWTRKATGGQTGRCGQLHGAHRWLSAPGSSARGPGPWPPSFLTSKADGPRAPLASCDRRGGVAECAAAHRFGSEEPGSNPNC